MFSGASCDETAAEEIDVISVEAVAMAIAGPGHLNILTSLPGHEAVLPEMLLMRRIGTQAQSRSTALARFCRDKPCHSMEFLLARPAKLGLLSISSRRTNLPSLRDTCPVFHSP